MNGSQDSIGSSNTTTAADTDVSRWHPSSDYKNLWKRLVSEIPEAETLVVSTAEQIVKHDADAWSEMSLPENEYRRDSYLIRYGLPLAELAGWPKRKDALVAEALAVNFFWAECWRRLDNVLDSNIVDQVEIGELAVAVCRATKIHIDVAQHLDIASFHEVLDSLRLVCAIAKEERRAPIEREDIWQRATPFLIVPRTLLRLSTEHEDIYKAYINVNGLAHDIHDLITDHKLGIQSLPVSWFGALDTDMAFRREVVNAWFDKAEQELGNAIEHIRRFSSVKELRVLSFFICEADERKASLGKYSLPIVETSA
jgi:hypothetical protein